jgi:hypothetical protein
LCRSSRLSARIRASVVTNMHPNRGYSISPVDVAAKPQSRIFAKTYIV